MTKRELIDEILTINQSARPGFLSRFTDGQLDEYLAHLRVLARPRLSGDPARYERYFRNCPTIRVPLPQWRQTAEHTEDLDAADLADGPMDGLEDDFDGAPGPAADYAELDVQPAERQQLYVEPDDLDEEDDDARAEAEEFGEELPARATVALAGPQPDDEDYEEEEVLLAPAEPTAADLDPEDESETDPDSADRPAEALAVAQSAGPGFAGKDDEPEAWLY
jgi:hypothetical protein